MTKEQARLLRFAIKYPGWHTMARPAADPKANRALNALVGAGLMVEYVHGRGNRQFALASQQTPPGTAPNVTLTTALGSTATP